MRIILITLLLTSCAYKPTITRDNAMDKCWLYGVKANRVMTKREDYKIVYLGKDIQDQCGVGRTACTVHSDRTIYMIEKDGWMEDHERCHEYTRGGHIEYKRNKKTIHPHWIK